MRLAAVSRPRTRYCPGSEKRETIAGQVMVANRAGRERNRSAYRELELLECDRRLRFFFLPLLRSLDWCERLSYLLRCEPLDTVDAALLDRGTGGEYERWPIAFRCVSRFGLFMSANCIPSCAPRGSAADIGCHRLAFAADGSHATGLAV